MSATYQRFALLDWTRGFAVLLMIIFHLGYDLNAFQLVRIDFFNDPFWYWFPRFIVFLFLLCVGVGLYLTHAKEIDWKKVQTRFFKIGGYALCISLFTFFAFPKNYVFFGTLHCIALCSVAGVFFVSRPHLSLFIGSLLIIPPFIWRFKIFDWSRILGIHSMDYVPFYPWFGVVLWGIFFASKGWHQVKIPYQKALPNLLLIWMGKHSLFIYLIHQVILFGLIYLISRFLV